MSGSSNGVGNDALGMDKLRKRVATLEALVAALKRWVKALIVVAVLALAGLAAVLVLYINIITGRSNTREYYNTQLRNLACVADSFIPPGFPLGDKLREQYNCPPYGQQPNVTNG